MKNTILKSIFALVMAFTALPMMSQNYLKIYFKDGHTERHFMHLVDNIAMTKYDMEGNLHEDYQMQQIVMPDTTYSYYLADIDSMTFRKVDEEQIKKDVETITNTVTPIFEQCTTIEEMEAFMDEIKRIEGVEDVWRAGTDIVVQIRDWHKVYYKFPLMQNNTINSLNNLAKYLSGKKFQVPVKKNGQPIKVGIAFQMIDDTRFDPHEEKLRQLYDEFKNMGFDDDHLKFIPNESGEILDLDFFTNRMFDYDIVVIQTHGGYDGRKHSFVTAKELPLSLFAWDLYVEKKLDFDFFDLTILLTKEEGDLIRKPRCYQSISEDCIKRSETRFSTDGPHIVFMAACSSLEGENELIHVHKGEKETFIGDSAVAKIFFDKGADIYMGYDKSTAGMGFTAYQFFHFMLKGLSQEAAFYYLDDEYLKHETHTEEQASLIDLVNPKSLKDPRRFFFFNTHTIEKTKQEINDEYKNTKKLELEGFTSCYNLESGGLRFGFKISKDPNIDDLSSGNIIESNDFHYTETKVGEVAFSAEYDPEPGRTYYYRAVTYDNVNYNWGEEYSFIVYDNITFSTNTVSLNVGESSTIDITSGSGTYSIEKIEPTGVVTASISENRIIIEALTSGTATITVKDGKSGQTSTIEVNVTDNTSTISYLNCPDEHHPHLINLGLPSGTLWSCCNVDANKPEGYGGYYAWGETEEKVNYDWSTYKHCDGTAESCHNLGWSISGTDYDVAHVKWGDAWQIATDSQQKELIKNCTSEWITVNGVEGRMFTSNINGGNIFLPAAGYHSGSNLMGQGEEKVGGYWSGICSMPSNDGYAHGLYFYESNMSQPFGGFRKNGFSIRPVMVSNNSLYGLVLSCSPSVTLEIGDTYKVDVISGNGSYSIECNPKDVVSAEVSGSSIFINAVKLGTATITVKDTKSGQTVTIDVTVIAKEASIETETFTVNGVSFKMVAVEGGTVTLGDKWEYSAFPLIDVTLNSFYIGETEVSQALWKAVMGDNPSNTKGDNLPVTNVSWFDCQEFIARLNQLTGRVFRLPTDAEWEFAARGGIHSKGYKYSGSNNYNDVSWFYENSNHTIQPVLSKQPNEIGLYNMSGNVSELCNDYYQEGISGTVNPTGPNLEWEEERVLRPSNVYNSAFPVWYRLDIYPDATYNVVGLRLAGGGGAKTIYTSCPDSPHPHMIDLGLPSGTKWSCCNLDAVTPESHGGYYAWGETKCKDWYDEDTYKYYNGKDKKYIDIGSDISGTQYDAAKYRWGDSWCMPTFDQFQELIDKCTYESSIQNGKNGFRFTGPNGASIFLPAMGLYIRRPELMDQYGLYFTSTTVEDDSSLANSIVIDINNKEIIYGKTTREYGIPIRPVAK